MQFDPKSLPIKNIILVPTAKSAELFLENLFPHYCECYVVSEDGAYPKNEELRKHIVELLKIDSTLSVVVFGVTMLKKMNVKTERILVMDNFIAPFYRKNLMEHLGHETGIKLDPNLLTLVMRSFFIQWKRMDRVGDTGYTVLSDGTDYRSEDYDWSVRIILGE